MGGGGEGGKTEGGGRPEDRKRHHEQAESTRNARARRDNKIKSSNDERDSYMSNRYQMENLWI